MGPIIYENDMSDGIVELDAEDKFNFKERLSEIKVPTLVIGGAEDPLYLMRETAEGIPGARLILHEKAGHTAMMKKDLQSLLFQNQIFLKQNQNLLFVILSSPLNQQIFFLINRI